MVGRHQLASTGRTSRRNLNVGRMSNFSKSMASYVIFTATGDVTEGSRTANCTESSAGRPHVTFGHSEVETVHRAPGMRTMAK